MFRSLIRGFLAALLLGTTVVVIPTRADEPPVVVAGGALDASFTGADVYVDTPRAAAAPTGRACAAAAQYVSLITEGQVAKVADLFEADAVVLDPTRRILHGRAAIGAFYENTIGAMRPQLVAVAYLGDDADCVVELAAKRPVRGALRFALVSVDHFTLGPTGKVARMVAFARPARTE
jgi:hypothetical protein